MSLTKKSKIGIFLLLMLFSFFMFGCKKSTTPVEDISFNLGESEQIVLIVGQTLEMGNYVEVKPHYASNKSYSITSYDESIVKIESNCLVAIGVGDTYIKVVSSDNSLKEDMMSVVVKGTKTALSTPKNLVYDSLTQTFNFDTVQNATSYTLKLNGEEINLGNSNVYKLTRLDMFDKRLVVQVRANAPTYTYALENSTYTDETKIYQAGAVKNATVKNGVLTFEKASGKSVTNLYIGQDVIFENSTENSFSFNNLNKSYAGKTIRIKIDSLVSDEIKAEYGDEVEYYSSTKEIEVNVLDIPTIKLASTSLSWQNIAYATGYKIYVDDGEVAQTQENYFDLKTLNNFNALITSSQIHNFKIIPITNEESYNIAKTGEESLIKVKRLTAPTLSFEGSTISWGEELNASAYAVVVSNGENTFETSTIATTLTTNGYSAGNYTISIQSIAKETADADDVYYISSKSTQESFEKKADISADIVNYELIITNAGTDKIKIDFDDNALDEIKVGNNEDIVISLKEHKFLIGTHEVLVTRLADNTQQGNFVDGTPYRKEFTQLEKIETATIENGTLIVQKSDTNKNAIVTLSTMGGSLPKPFVVESDEYTYNTTNNVPETNFLASGSYATSIYAYGDGSSTFSYRDDAGVVAVCLVKEFNVLPVPTVAVLNPQNDEITISAVDNAVSYDVYNVTEQSKVNIEETVYPFTLGETGNIQFAVQAIGDNKQYLNSIVSLPITIERLKKPTLTYNHATEIISMKDDNIEGVVSGYEFKHNGEVVNYDFVSKYPLTEDSVFTIQAISVGFENGVYYLNSNIEILNLEKITNQATITLNEDNQLEILLTSHSERYALEVVFGFEDGNHTYVSQDNTLTDGNDIINFTYSDGKYVLDLVNTEHNAVVEGFKKEFSVKVKFIKLEDNNKNLIDSEYTAEQNFNLIKISNTSTISINQNNQLEIKPTAHNEEYALLVVINDGEERIFVSNGANKLVGTAGELNYNYDADNKVYKVDLLKSDLTTAIVGLNSDFTVKVKYCYNHNGVATDLDSEFSQVKNIDILPVAELTREEQNLKIKNVQQTYTVEYYSLLINDEYVVEMSQEDVAYVDGYFVFSLDLVYGKTPNEKLKEVNSISVLVKNVETNEQNPQLSTLGEKLYVSKTQTIELVSYKFNNNEDGKNNNSVVVEFEAYETSYAKQYVVEIYNDVGTNKQIKRFEDVNVSNGKISFNLDDVVGIEGVIFIKAYVSTNGNYVETNTVEVFNSIYSNEIEIERILAVQDLQVSNSVLKFSATNNVVGYEVYEKTASGYIKLNNDLILENEYVLTNISGKKQIVVKAISQTNGFTNSSYSEQITIHKIETPTISVVDGKFHVGLSPELILLLANEKVSVIPEVKNNQTDIITLELKDLDGVVLQLIGTTLIAEPYMFLSYNAQSLLPEELALQIRVEYDEKATDVYYLNSDIAKINAYGLFKPTSVSKTTNENNSVELLTWVPSVNNVLNGANVSVGYLLKIEHTKGDESSTYYSNDTKLKYYDTANSKYVSYPTYINGSSAIFPAGYDADGDGNLDVKFDEGKFKISVQAVPTEIGSSYALCRSQYTDVYEFEILAQAELSMQEGKIVWEHQEKASKYQVSIYEGDETAAVLVDTVNLATYDFTNKTLKALSGVYRVVVKPISTSDDAVNGKDSEPIYVYRLPEAYGVHIDDGELVLTSTAFFDVAEFEFVDNTTGTIYVEKIDNISYATQKLADLKIENWKSFADDATINASIKNSLVLGRQATSIIDGRDYTINVTLKGNSNSNLGFVSSSKVVKISDLTTSKLKPNATEVSLGVIQFEPDKDYVTISNGVFIKENSFDLNYVFNNATATPFWANTVVYKIEITYSEGVLEIFAVDYYSLLTAISNGTISSDEYEILVNTKNIYANVKYKYNDGTDKYICFNVYKDNIINLRDYDYLEYYHTTSIMTDGVNAFASETTMKNLNLEVGGSFTLNFFMLGGDSNNSVGTLSSNANGLKTFVRYGINELSSSEGKVKFNNLLPVVNSKEVDNPIYKVVVTPLNSATNKVFYIYHSTEEDAKLIASRLDADYLKATYVQAEIEEKDKNSILFDLSSYIENGAYKVSIRTLAGLGSDEDSADYLLNAKEPSVEYSFHKLTNTEFEAGEGVLTFAQSYIVRDSYIYNDNYEITLFDGDKEYVYQISRTSDGVKINDTTHIVTYTLPSQIVIDDKTMIEIASNKQYQIKIKPIAKENYVLNGTYLQQASQDVVLTFKKSQGLSEVAGQDLRIEDGILKWNVVDTENHVNTVIKISFLDENEQVKNIYLTVADMNKVVENGEYKYHFYEFTDEKYNLETTGSVYITDGEEYTISAYVTGINTAEEIILNSNYSSQIVTSRLKSVGSEIKTVDGVLTWAEIENATSYSITITGTQKHETTSITNSLDILASELNLPVGTYTVQIRANGTTQINSMKSSIIEGFVQLGEVDKASIKIESGKIVWDAVPNAQGYEVVFNYSDAEGTKQVTEIVETNEFIAPIGVVGEFSLTIKVVGIGEGKVFNGATMTPAYTSSNNAPTQAQKLEFDDVNNRLVAEINLADFYVESDKVMFVYNFEKYISNTEKTTQRIEKVTFGYENTNRYEIIDENTIRYYCPLTVMGVYSNIYVQIIRPETLPSNAIQTDDINFKLFSFGAGTFDNPSTQEDEYEPYRISNAQELLNIKYFPSANYILTASINMKDVNIVERLQANSGALISSEFKGMLDGNNFTIFGFNKNETERTDTINVTDFENFALFGTLNDATIKNITFGEENYELILLNTFANNTSNMINLSLIATGATNSTIEKIKLLNFKVLISSNLMKTEGSINIAGLIVNSTNTTIKDVTEKLTVKIDMFVETNVEVRIGGILTNATNSTITASGVGGTNINFNVETKVDNLLSYVGGAVAYYIGNTAKSTGLTNTNVEFTISNVQAEYFGGLIGFARYALIQTCETTGSYSQQEINYSAYIGGLIGYAQSVTIVNSGSLAELTITLASDIGTVYVGAIAGMLTIQGSVACVVQNCYSDVYNEEQLKSQVDNDLGIIVGIYGNEINSNITVSCYKKEK